MVLKYTYVYLSASLHKSKINKTMTYLAITVPHRTPCAYVGLQYVVHEGR